MNSDLLFVRLESVVVAQLERVVSPDGISRVSAKSYLRVFGDLINKQIKRVACDVTCTVNSQGHLIRV